jgi:hypothetical protein
MATASIAPDAAGERPRSVNVVGGVFLVLSSIRFLFDLIGWVVWKLGDPGPVIAFFLPRGEHGLVPVDWVMAHFPTVVAVQGTIAACVAGISIQFLRLRPWARRALEVVAWMALAVTGTLGIGFAWVWARLSRSGNFAPVLAGLVVAGLLLVAAIRAMRRPDVRAAFRV